MNNAKKKTGNRQPVRTGMMNLSQNSLRRIFEKLSNANIARLREVSKNYRAAVNSMPNTRDHSAGVEQEIYDMFELIMSVLKRYKVMKGRYNYQEISTSIAYRLHRITRNYLRSVLTPDEQDDDDFHPWYPHPDNYRLKLPVRALYLEGERFHWLLCLDLSGISKYNNSNSNSNSSNSNNNLNNNRNPRCAVALYDRQHNILYNCYGRITVTKTRNAGYDFSASKWEWPYAPRNIHCMHVHVDIMRGVQKFQKNRIVWQNRILPTLKLLKTVFYKLIYFEPPRRQRKERMDKIHFKFEIIGQKLLTNNIIKHKNRSPWVDAFSV